MSQSRFQRALAHAPMADYVREGGVFQSEAHLVELARLHARLEAGARVTDHDITRLQPFWPAIPRAFLQKIADGINSAGSAPERANRVVDIVYESVDLATGAPLRASPYREQAREFSRNLATQDAAAPLMQRRDERDRHIDRMNGIDRSRDAAENAKRVAMQNTDSVRSHVERAWDKHDTTRVPVDRRGQSLLVADAIERNIHQKRERSVLAADPHRNPARSDDRCRDISNAYDEHMLNDAAHDLLRVGDSPTLSATNDALDAEVEREREAP